MPVRVNLAQFPRVQCRRCGVVALVDPAIPHDERPNIVCPNCTRNFFGNGRPADPLVLGKRHAPGAETAAPPARQPVVGPLPSSAAVGVALAALFILALIGYFVFELVTPHQSYWWALTR